MTSFQGNSDLTPRPQFYSQPPSLVLSGFPSSECEHGNCLCRETLVVRRRKLSGDGKGLIAHGCNWGRKTKEQGTQQLTTRIQLAGGEYHTHQVQLVEECVKSCLFVLALSQLHYADVRKDTRPLPSDVCIPEQGNLGTRSFILFQVHPAPMAHTYTKQSRPFSLMSLLMLSFFLCSSYMFHVNPTALNQAGRHMEDSIVASYTALLLGILAKHNPVRVSQFTRYH